MQALYLHLCQRSGLEKEGDGQVSKERRRGCRRTSNQVVELVNFSTCIFNRIIQLRL